MTYTVLAKCEFIEEERKRWHKVKKTVGDAYTQREHPDLT